MYSVNEQISHVFQEESKKVRADSKLDINLERSRVTDMVNTECSNIQEAKLNFIVI